MPLVGFVLEIGTQYQLLANSVKIFDVKCVLGNGRLLVKQMKSLLLIVVVVEARPRLVVQQQVHFDVSSTDVLVLVEFALRPQFGAFVVERGCSQIPIDQGLVDAQ